MTRKKLSPAAPLDIEPPVYKGLGMTSLGQVALGSAMIWITPALAVSFLLADGYAVVMTFISIMLVATLLSVVLAAHGVRRLQRDRPKNWIRRRIATLLKLRVDLVTNQHWSM